MSETCYEYFFSLDREGLRWIQSQRLRPIKITITYHLHNNSSEIEKNLDTGMIDSLALISM